MILGFAAQSQGWSASGSLLEMMKTWKEPGSLSSLLRFGRHCSHYLNAFWTNLAYFLAHSVNSDCWSKTAPYLFQPGLASIAPPCWRPRTSWSHLCFSDYLLTNCRFYLCSTDHASPWRQTFFRGLQAAGCLCKITCGQGTLSLFQSSDIRIQCRL